MGACNGHHTAPADITGLWVEGPGEGGTDTDLPAMFLKYEKDSGSHHKGLTQQYAAPAPCPLLGVRK